MEDGSNDNLFGPQVEAQGPIPIVSPLAGLGTSPTRFNRRWLIGIALIVGILIAAVSFVLLCSANFTLPNDTLFLATATPRTLNQLLSHEQRAALPNTWRVTLEANSNWPIVFGLRGSTLEPQAFVLGPRWSIPKGLDADQTAYFIRSAGSSLHAPRAFTLNYRDSAFSFWFHRGNAQGWGDPEEFFLPATTSSTAPIYFSLDHGKLILRNSRAQQATLTNHPLSTVSSTAPLAADLSLNLGALSEQVNSAELISRLPITPLRTTLSSLSQMPSIFEIQFDSSSSLSALHLDFDGPLAPTERRSLLANLDQSYKTQLLTLPDGTYASEHRASTDIQESTISNSTDQPAAHTFNWQTTSSTPLTFAKACSTGIWLVRLSPNFLERLHQIAPSTTIWSPQTALQIWRNSKQEIVVCRES